jgi:hypothetical protein
MLDWIRKKHEVKETLKADLLKVINSEQSLGELHKRLDTDASDDGKIFHLEDLTKFEKSYVALDRHPLSALYKKIVSNTKKGVYNEYFPKKRGVLKSKNSIHLDDLVVLKNKADEFKDRLRRKTKKLAQKNKKQNKKHVLRMPSIQDLVTQKDMVMGIIKTQTGKKSMNLSQQAIFKSSVIQKVQEQNLLDRFDFTTERKFLVTAIVTTIDHFVSKPRDFELLNTQTYR